MIETGREVELRRQEILVGHKMVLNNGETWTVPSMPMGKASTWFANKIDEVQDLDTSDMKKFIPIESCLPMVSQRSGSYRLIDAPVARTNIVSLCLRSGKLRSLRG